MPHISQLQSPNLNIVQVPDPVQTSVPLYVEGKYSSFSHMFVRIKCETKRYLK